MFRLASIIAGLVLLTSPLQAQTLPFASVQMCDAEPGRMFSKIQEEYGEIPFLTGSTVVQTFPQQKWLKGEFYMLLNPENGSFTIIVRDPDSGLECLWLAGEVVPAATGDGI